MKQQNLDRLQALLDGNVADPTDRDLKLLRKAERRIFRIVSERAKADNTKFTFREHKTLQ